MSLQIAANHLASKGRGPDSQLVHMAPTEVAGLQALAKAHGGSLTINPETGLPEAGFLSNILPMVIGAGLSVASGGTLTPMMAGLMTGAGYGLIKGDLKAGLMAGLGAYGGAGMMGSVLGAGASAAQEAAIANAGADSAAASMTVPTAEQAAQLSSGSALETGLAKQGIMPVAQSASNVASTGVGAGQYGLGPTSMSPGQLPVAQTVAAPATPMPTQAAISNQAAANATKDYLNSGFMDQMKGGIGALAQDPSKLMTGANLKYGLAAAAPAMFEEPKQATYEGDSEQAKYTYSPGRVENPEAGQYASSERTWFQPRYTRMMAEGGPVSDMSARNEGLMLLANGGQQFADGGSVDYEFDPVTKTYKPKQAAPMAAVQPIMATTTSGGANPTLDPKVAEFLDRETPAERDARMQGISNVIGMLSPGSMVNAAMQGLGALAGNQPTYGGAPVVAMGSDTGFGGGTGDSNYGGVDNTGAAMSAADADAAYSADNYASGGYAAGGKFLRGPGDGVSDSIPATIGGNQPARLADGEFVVPARIVSELGNGSSEAGARKLYAMMDRVQKARRKTVGKNKVATDSKAEKMLPA